MAVVLKTTARETVPGVRIPLPPPISSFVPLREEVERLNVSGTDTSAIERAVRKQCFEQTALLGRILGLVKKFGLFRKF